MRVLSELELDMPTAEAVGEVEVVEAGCAMPERVDGMWRSKTATVWAVLGVLGLLPLVLLACGSAARPSDAAVTALRRVVPIQPGQPVLVFVYTDG